jgi:hypothetical protein
MPRSQAQSDFVVYPAAAPTDGTQPVEPVDEAAPGALPPAALRSVEASATATRWVMALTWFMLILLVLLCLIGPHIPSGE